MSKPSAINLKTSRDFEGLFTPTTSPTKAHTENQIVEIEIEKLLAYPNQPFKPYQPDKLAELAGSIRENGLLYPIIVSEIIENKSYYVLAGRNRVDAHKLLNLKTVKAIIKKGLSQEEADIIVVETNLKTREKLYASEKARAYKMQMEALNRQGKRTDLTTEKADEMGIDSTSCRVCTKIDSADEMSKVNNDSRRTIYMYIKLNNLTPDLLDLVDDEVLSFNAGVEIAYLNADEQNAVFTYFFADKKAKLDIKTAAALRELSKTKEVSYQTIHDLFNGASNKPKKPSKIEIPLKKLGGILDHVDEDKRLDYIIEALRFYSETKLNEPRDS